VAQKLLRCILVRNSAGIVVRCAKLGCKAVVHQIDTGMGRIGVHRRSRSFAAHVAALPGIEVEAFLAFCNGDCEDKRYAHSNSALSRALQNIDATVSSTVRHIANSAATLELPEYHLVWYGRGSFCMNLAVEIKRSCAKTGMS
jgi:alanine racemase